MDKLKKFKKFEISNERAAKVKGKLACHFSAGGAHYIRELDVATAETVCRNLEEYCMGCF